MPSTPYARNKGETVFLLYIRVFPRIDPFIQLYTDSNAQGLETRADWRDPKRFGRCSGLGDTEFDLIGFFDGRHFRNGVRGFCRTARNSVEMVMGQAVSA